MPTDLTPRSSEAPVALVTGASRGIGRRTALALASDGYDVAFTARTVAEGAGRVPPRRTTADTASVPVPGSLQRTAEEVEALGRRALPVQMDLLDRASVHAATAEVTERWGPVDVLVNNAIAHLPGGHDRLRDLDVDVAAAMITANYLHQVVLVQDLLPGMVAAGGATIVDICSGSAVLDPPAPPGEGGWGLAYAASKAAFGRLAGSLNAEYGHAGIRAFNLDPGFVVTEASMARGGTEAIAEQGFAPDDEAATGRVVCWLARDPEADAHLGRTVRAPRLATELAGGGTP